MEAEKHAEALYEPKDHEFGKANSLPVGETKVRQGGVSRSDEIITTRRL